MRKLLLISLLGVVLVFLAGFLVFQMQAQAAGPSKAMEQPMNKAKTVTLTGEVVDLGCYLSNGLHGQDHKACAVECANNGVPLGLLDEKTHKLYLDMGDFAMAKNAPVLKGHEAERVTVTALVYEKDGLPGMSIKTLTPAK